MTYRFMRLYTTESYAQIEADSYEEALQKLEEEDPIFMDSEECEDTKCICEDTDEEFPWSD